MFDLRLVAHAPFGDRLSVLPHPLSVEVGWPLNDVPSLKLAYTTAAIGADLLDQPCEITVQWSVDGTTWTEEPDSRFLRIKRRGDGSDPTGLTRFELPGMVWMLRKIVLYPGAAPLVNGKRPFLAATAGAILQTFIAEAKGRGAVPGLNWDFTPDTDSAGQAWNKVLTIYHQPGTDALTALQNLAEQGVCDYRVSGRTVQVFNADTAMQRDLASGPAPVDLRYGRDIAEAPDDGTLEDTASSVLVVGDNGLVKTFTNSAAVQPWGRWEQYIGAGGVSDEGTAAVLADSALERAGSERVQRTRGIVLYGGRRLPLKDYRPGDQVLAPGDGGGLEPLRVRQVTLARAGSGVVGGALVLNDRFLERKFGWPAARRASSAAAPLTEGRVTGRSRLRKLQSRARQAGHIQANAIEADKIKAGAIVAGHQRIFDELRAEGGPLTGGDMIVRTGLPAATAFRVLQEMTADQALVKAGDDYQLPGMQEVAQ